MPPLPPFHQRQIERTLPAWSKELHPDHARQVVQRLRKDYLDERGKPYAWYAEADDTDQRAIDRAIDVRDRSRRALQQALAGLKGITEFCRPLLQQRLGSDVVVDKAQYVYQPFELEQPGPTLQPAITRPTEPYQVIPKGEPQLRSLLEAALHNFRDDVEPGRLSRLQRSRTDPFPVTGLTLKTFIAYSRALDLGQRYQEHLQSVYQGAEHEQLKALANQASRDELRVQGRIAKLRGLLSPKGAVAIEMLCTAQQAPNYGNQPLHCWRIELFGMGLHELMLLGPDQPGEVNPVIVYLPGDSQHPVHEYASLRAAAQALVPTLTDTAQRRKITNLAPLALQPTLERSLRRALFVDPEGATQPHENPHLNWNKVQLPALPWEALHTLHVQRIMADARCIAVPTADIDAQARLERLEHWADIGLTVLNMAAMFIPGLNPIMMAIGAAQLMGSVFHGIEAWEQGDNAEALAQVESIVVNVASIGLLGAGTALLASSGFVDAMRSVLVDGKELLWSPRLDDYQSPSRLPGEPEPDALGQYHADGRTYIRLDGRLHEVVQSADGTWQIEHPTQPNAPSVALEHNGEGAWRGVHESPLEWDLDTLLRRLGPAVEDLPSSDRAKAWDSTGMQAGVLQRVHLSGSKAPALLSDAITRLRLDNQTRDLIDAIRTGRSLAAHRNFALPELLELPEWPENHAFEITDGASTTYYGPDTRRPTDSVITISRTELGEGKLVPVLLEQLDEAQVRLLIGESVPLADRVQALQRKLADRLTVDRGGIFERLYQAQEPRLQPAATRLATQFPGLPKRVVEEIVATANSAERALMANNEGRVPLRVAEEARWMQARVRLDRAILGLYRPSLATADTATLSEGLRALQPTASQTLFEAAVADRQQAARLIGQQPIRPGFRSPLRLGHGQLGYPLSGRGLPRRTLNAGTRRLEALYPQHSPEQIGLLRGNTHADGVRQLEQQHSTLRQGLSSWISESATLSERLARQEYADILKGAWAQESREAVATLVFERLEIGSLPTLETSLPHIRNLTLTHLRLANLDAHFLSWFPNLEKLTLINPELPADAIFSAVAAAPKLRELDLSSNNLRTLGPKGREVLSNLRHLEHLDLRRNGLALDETDIQSLAQLQLETLHLAHNQITLDERAAAAFQRLIHLKTLNLNLNPLNLAPDVRYMARLEHLRLESCGLQRWPDGLTTLMSQRQYRLREVDLSSNAIFTVPDLQTVLNTPYAQAIGQRSTGHGWRFNYNEMESTTRAHLTAIGVAVFEHEETLPDWQAFWRAGSTPEQKQLWSDLFDQGQNLPLMDILDPLARSAESQRFPQSLKARVWKLLELAGQDTALRERLNEVAELFPVTCEDASTDAFSTVETEVLMYEASQGNAPLVTQYELYSKLYRREQVNALAYEIARGRRLRRAALEDNLDDVPALHPLDDPLAIPDRLLREEGVDDIEIRLALRQNLYAVLDYPEPTSQMSYQPLAKITPTVNINVARWIRDLESDAAMIDRLRREWLVEQPAWRAAVAKRHAAQFDSNTALWHQGLDYLAFCETGEDPPSELPRAVIRTLRDALGQAPVEANGSVRRLTLNQAQASLAYQSLRDQQQETEKGLLLSLTQRVQQQAA